MKETFLSTAELPTEKGWRWKAIVQGIGDDHLMNWRGADAKCLTVKGQPKMGFATNAEALAFLDAMDSETAERELERADDSLGRSIPTPPPAWKR